MADDWIVTHTEHLPNGGVRLRGVSPSRGPFQLTLTAEEHATMGVHAAVRAYYDHHPIDRQGSR